MMLVITKAMIAHEICGTLCGMVESMTCSCSEPLPEHENFVLIRKWRLEGDTWRALLVSRAQLLEGFNCYAGCGCSPEQTRIPDFISSNWERSEEVYKKLKGL